MSNTNGKVYVTATFNNTLVSITDTTGNVVAWGSAGSAGFKGARRATPFAARKAMAKGIREVEVFLKGPGSGRDAALRALKSAGMKMNLIADVTPVPHNGVRLKKRRRV